MPRYEVRLLQTVDAADDPVEAVDKFIMATVNSGMRALMYRVQDLDNDPAGSDLRYVQNRTSYTIWEAADLYGVDLGDDEDDEVDDDEEGIPTDPQPIVAEWTTGDRTEDPEPYTDDSDSVVNVDTD